MEHSENEMITQTQLFENEVGPAAFQCSFEQTRFPKEQSLDS